MPLRFVGKLYRALNPVYAREPLSGRGAELYGGRFNPKGVPTFYASMTIMTALREANQVGALQPTTLVSYDADIDAVFDGRDEADEVPRRSADANLRTTAPRRPRSSPDGLAHSAKRRR